VDLYIHSPVRLRDVVLSEAQGLLVLSLEYGNICI
jgi:hypothetical protein